MEGDDPLMTKYGDITAAFEPHGLIPRGGFVPSPADGLGDAAAVVLVGNAGPRMFDVFSRWRGEEGGTAPHPIDRWCRQVIERIAGDLGATVIFPFDGPPYRPFQQWAMRAEPVWPSPLGMFIHPRYGLWHAYRGALVFTQPVDLPEQEAVSAPCDGCADRPCLGTCPVGAFRDGPATNYDVDACARHLATDAGADCMALGCRARRACPVGTEYVYIPQQAAFHMDAFLSAR